MFESFGVLSRVNIIIGIPTKANKPNSDMITRIIKWSLGQSHIARTKSVE